MCHETQATRTQAVRKISTANLNSKAKDRPPRCSHSRDGLYSDHAAFREVIRTTAVLYTLDLNPSAMNI